MNEIPDLLWLAVTTLGVLAMGGMIIYAMNRYRAWQDKRRPAQPTDRAIDCAELRRQRQQSAGRLNVVIGAPPPCLSQIQASL